MRKSIRMNMKFCCKCGKSNGRAANFCRSCGAPHKLWWLNFAYSASPEIAKPQFVVPGWLKTDAGAYVLPSLVVTVILIALMAFWPENITASNNSPLAAEIMTKVPEQQPEETIEEQKDIITSTPAPVPSVSQQNPTSQENTTVSIENNDQKITPVESFPVQISDNIYMITGQISAKSGISIRETPSVNGKKLGMLKYATKVAILSQDGPTETIEGIESNWFKILAGDSIVGWAFGGFFENIEEHILPGKAPVKIKQFADLFFGNKDFQGKHIRFPLKFRSQGPDTEEEEETMLPGDYKEPLSINFRESVETAFSLISPENFTLRVRGKESGILVLYNFEIQADEIFLVEVLDLST